MFKQAERSLEKEWLDEREAYLTEVEYEDCLKKLFRVNYALNFFGDTLSVLKSLPKNASVLDVGCGDGLFALHLSKRFPMMQIDGIDYALAAIQLAQKKLQQWRVKSCAPHVNFYQMSCADIMIADKKYDAVLSTLMCHHLTDQEIVKFLQDAVSMTNHVVIINDLHRHPLASLLFKIIQPILCRGRVLKHDGLMSIRKSFDDSDWKRLLAAAGIKTYLLQWRFPFRWRVVIWKTSL